VIDVDWVVLLCLDEDDDELEQHLLALVQLEQHLLALVLLLPSMVQDVLWATHQWRACSLFSLPTFGLGSLMSFCS
jgi:hypothetical protein